MSSNGGAAHPHPRCRLPRHPNARHPRIKPAPAPGGRAATTSTPARRAKCRRTPAPSRPVRVWGYPVVPLLFVVATFLILGNALREHPGGTGLAFGGILLGVPVYWWWLRDRQVQGPV